MGNAFWSPCWCRLSWLELFHWDEHSIRRCKLSYLSCTWHWQFTWDHLCARMILLWAGPLGWYQWWDCHLFMVCSFLFVKIVPLVISLSISMLFDAQLLSDFRRLQVIRVHFLRQCHRLVVLQIFFIAVWVVWLQVQLLLVQSQKSGLLISLWSHPHLSLPQNLWSFPWYFQGSFKAPMCYLYHHSPSISQDILFTVLVVISILFSQLQTFLQILQSFAQWIHQIQSSLQVQPSLAWLLCLGQSFTIGGISCAAIYLI